MDFYLRKMVHIFSVNVNQNKTVCHLSLAFFNCRYNWKKNCQLHLLIKNFKSFLKSFGFNMVFWPKTYRKLDKTFSLEEILFKAEFFFDLILIFTFTFVLECKQIAQCRKLCPYGFLPPKNGSCQLSLYFCIYHYN